MEHDKKNSKFKKRAFKDYLTNAQNEIFKFKCKPKEKLKPNLQSFEKL